MKRLVLDAVTLAKLGEIRETVQVCDEQGQIVAIIGPPTYFDTEIPFTDEEIEELRRQPLGRPLSEIMRDLEARG